MPIKNLFDRKLLLLYLFILVALGCLFWDCLPNPLFNDATSTVIEDRKDNLLGAMVTADGQWRFPYDSVVSPKFKKCIITFEDKRFYHHPGIDVLALMRATWQHITFQKTRSGGSTITTQVIRL